MMSEEDYDEQLAKAGDFHGENMLWNSYWN